MHGKLATAGGACSNYMSTLPNPSSFTVLIKPDAPVCEADAQRQNHVASSLCAPGCGRRPVTETAAARRPLGPPSGSRAAGARRPAAGRAGAARARRAGTPLPRPPRPSVSRRRPRSSTSTATGGRCTAASARHYPSVIEPLRRWGHVETVSAWFLACKLAFGPIMCITDGLG